MAETKLHARGTAPARPGLVTLTVIDVPPGVYGVLAHHDANDDGVVNRDLLGRPQEGIGFSREAPIRFGPPRFEDAQLAISGSRVTIPIRLVFEPEPARTSSL